MWGTERMESSCLGEGSESQGLEYIVLGTPASVAGTHFSVTCDAHSDQGGELCGA